MAIKSICSILECSKPAHCRGWCRNHYERWRRYKDPLAGRIARGEATRFFHEIVLSYDGDECLFWPYARVRGGYGELKQGIRVHRLVCEAVNGPPPTPHHFALHSCGKGHLGCCASRHLRWGTALDNSRDRSIHGTLQLGVNHVCAKLTEKDVLEIRAMRGTMQQKDIAKIYGVTKENISAIHTRRTWKHI